MNFQFDSDEACKYGVNEAVMISNFRFWILKNRANAKHFYDGKYWTYNSLIAFTKIFPFWTRRQVERIINNLKDKGVLVQGSYNQKGYDKTAWYAFADEETFLGAYHQTVTPISPNGDVDVTKRGQGHHQTVTPIPDTITYTNTDSETNIYLGADAPMVDWNKKFIDAYFLWYKESNNNEDPKLDKGDYAGLKGIREYLAKIKKGDYQKALQAFEYILQNWAILKDYRYLQSGRSPKKINSNLVDILPILREHHKKVSTKKMVI